MATQEPQPSKSLARQEVQMTGAFRRPADITDRLLYANEKYHLVAPATAVGAIPEGTAVAISMVEVDLRDMGKGGETYHTGNGNYGIARSALNRIAQAAGISWDPDKSRRLDDGSDPYYVHFRAVGTLKTFDGSELVITGEKEMDLRPGSPQIDALKARKRDGGSIEGQLRELRLHILAHAESKAKNRAIRSIGLKSSFKKEDLDKPFVVAKLMWTGQSDDPELRREFARMQAERMLGAPSALFSTAGPAPAPLRPALPPVKSPPPVGSVPAASDDEGFYAPPPSGGRTTIDAPPATDSSPTSPSRSAFTIPGGKFKGKPLREAPDETLEYWLNRITANLEDGSTPERYRESNSALADAMQAELDARHGVVPEGDEPSADDEGRY